MTASYFQPAAVHGLALDRHAVIEASAGTGKTYTMAHLAIALILAGTPVEQILAVTFTNRATAELRARIRGLLDELCQGGSRGEPPPEARRIELDATALLRLRTALFNFDRAPILTIHAFCQRVLGDFPLDCDLGFDLEISDGRLAFHRALRAVIRERMRDQRACDLMLRWMELPGKRDETRIDKLEGLLFEAYRLRYRVEGASPAPGGVNLDREMVEAFLPAVIARLEQDKRRLGQIDYEDLLRQLWKALEGPGGAHLSDALQKRYRYALVDEFQDTDDLQWNILQRLFVASRAGNVLMVVGDPKQAIYAFRGADVQAYLRARPLILGDGKLLKLATNYRSTQALVAACNLIFDPTARAPLLPAPIEYEPAQAAQPPTTLEEAGGVEPAPVVVMRVAGEGISVAAARAALGRRIAAIIDEIRAGRLAIVERDQTRRPVRLADVFILTRAWSEAREAAGYLREAGIPYIFYKQDKLFETAQARALLDILRAIEAPEQRSRRLAGWSSPFFGLEFDHLAALGEVPPGDPLNQRLYDWRVMAQREQWAQLFASLMHRSGLVGRELFGSDSARALINYQQLCEILLNVALSERLSLPQLVSRLADYVGGRALPPGENGDVQRVSHGGDAVQLMTIHLSKGLEAAVVFLFGGLSARTVAQPVAVYHQDGQRRVVIGQNEAKNKPWARETEQEERRMLYVALTRARARLYLPLFPPKTLKRGVTGCYKPLNQRLEEILAPLSPGPRDQDEERRRLFALEEVAADDGENFQRAVEEQGRLDRMVASWSPPPQLLDGTDGRPPVYYDNLRRAHGALAMRSYSQMAGLQAQAWAVEVEDLKLEAPAADDDSLAGGRMVGIMLHEVLQRVDFALLREVSSAGAWLAHPEVRGLFEDAMGRWGVRDSRWLEQGAEMLFRALTTRFELPGLGALQPLYQSQVRREMEFVFPIPERSHALLGNPQGAGWRVERGYFKGFIDLVFEQAGRVYFADWKSDHLASYAPAALAAHVGRHYSLQATIYTIGVLRWLGVREEADYARRFGGLLYLFLRAGGADPRQGVFFHRPTWPEVCAYEAELMRRAG